MKNAIVLRPLYLCFLLLFSSLPAAWSQDIKADTTSMATPTTATGNWWNTDPGPGNINGATLIVPATTDIGEFDATVSANSLANMTLGGANLVLGGLQFDLTMNGQMTLGAGNTLSVGASGINMSLANTNVTINAKYQSGTSQTWNVATNTTLTLNGTVLLDQSSSAANQDPNFPTSAGTQVLTITGNGTINVPNSILEPNFTGSGTGIASTPGVLITGGTFNGAGVLIQRSANLGTTYPTIAAPFNPVTTAGFVVNGANTSVTLGTLTIGGGFGNNPGSANIMNGTTTVTGAVIIGDAAGNSNPQRWGGFEVQGGSFTALDTTTGFVIAQSDGGVLNPMEIYFAGGVSTIAKILIGSPIDPANATNRTAIFIKGGTLYVGSQGIALGNNSTNNIPYNGTNGYVISYFSGVLGAYTNWSSSLNMVLSSTTDVPFIIQTADSNNVSHNITLSGIISGANTAPLMVTGGGTLTLANANIYAGNIAINGGTVNLGAAETAGISGPLGQQLASAAGTILFGGGTLQYSAANQNDYSGRFDNGTLGSQPISIDTAGQNITFTTTLAGTGTSLTLKDSGGTGSLTVTAPSTYDTGTFVNSGTLNVNNTSGSGTGTGNVIVGGTGKLGGSGTISGNVVVNSGGETIPGAITPGLTTTIGGNLTYNPGSSAIFSLSASASGPGNDEIVLNGPTSTLNCGNVLTVNVTGAGLDSHDYVLYNVPNNPGGISGAFTTIPNFTGTPLLHPSFYSVQKIGSQIVLHFTSVNPPTITGQTVLPASVQANQNVTISAMVTPGDNSISTVTVNLSQIGGSATQALVNTGGNNWSVTIIVPVAAFLGTDSLGITATDTHNTTTTVSVPLTVTAATGTAETWNGGIFGTSPNWSQNGNWASALAPGFGDNIFFAGSTGPTPVMDQSYSLASVTFMNGAVGFTITNNGNNGILALTGGVTNNSSSQQVLNVPVAISAATVTVNDAASAGVVLGGVISGSSIDGLTTAGNVILNNANTFAGTTVASSGTLKLNNVGALQNSTLNYNGSGTVSFSTLTAASIGALSGSKNLSLENSTPAPVALNIGSNNTSQTFSGNLTDTGNGASLTISGTGTQTLTGINTYTGGTTNGNSSTLIVGGSGLLGNGTYAGPILNNGTLTYNTTAAQTLLGTISGIGMLNNTGVGTLTLSGVNTFSGFTSISAVSKLTIGAAGQLGSGTYAQNITDNGTLTYNSTAPQILSGTISGTGALTDSGTGKLTLSAANAAFSGTTTTGTGATLQLNNSDALKNSVLNYSAGSVSFGNGITLANLGGLSGTSSSQNLALVDSGSPVTLNIVNSVNRTYAGVLSDGGLGGSLLVGGANQTLTGTNTYTGDTTVLSGTLTVGGAGQLGGGNYGAILSPQTGANFIWASSDAQILAGQLEGGGNIQLTGTGPLTTIAANAYTGSTSIGSGSTFTISGASQLLGSGGTGAYGGAITDSGTFNYNSSNTTTLSGAIAGSGGKINVNAPFNGATSTFGELSLTSGSSTYSNCITTITSGILSYSSDGSAGAVPGSVITNIFLNGGDLMGSGTFTLNTNRTIGIGLTSGAIGTNALIDATGIFTIGGAIASAGNTGAIGLVVNSELGSSGTVSLAGVNTYTGNTTISAGTLSISDPGTLDNGIYAGNITNGGILDYSSSAPQTLAGVISDDALIGPGALSVGGVAPASGTNTGKLTLTGTNTYTGSTTIGGGSNGGTLTLAGGGQLGAGSYAGNINNSGVLNFNGTATQSLSGGISGSGALNHNGTGTLTLSGNISYYGTTTNNNGTITLVGDGLSSGVLSGSSIITVNSPGIINPTGLALDGSLHIGDPNVRESSQTLSGNGSVISNLVVGAFGTLTPGPATGYGTLTVGHNLVVGDTINGGGAMIMNIDHLVSGAANNSVTAKSIIILTNGSTLLPTLIVNQGANDLQTGDTFHLFNITGNTGISTLTNLIVTLPASSPDSVYTYVWNTSNLAVNGTLKLTTGAPAVSPVNTNAATAHFTATRTAGSLQFSWATDHLGWQLYTNSVGLTATGSWFPLSGSSAVTNETIIINLATPNVFFQLRYP